MLYLVAIVLPPLALLMVGAWFQAILNLILFVFAVLFAILSFGTLWVICVAWALIVVYRVKDEARTRRIVSDTLRNNQP
jgi:uncharacterized membrane protein YqaE (UPF0057 family)